MDSTIMKIFYGADLLPYKDEARSVHYPIIGNAFNGASNVTEIRFYVDYIGGTETAEWMSVATLPNGKKGYKLLEKGADTEIGEDYVVLPLSKFYTQVNGNVYIGISGYAGGSEIVYDDEDDTYKIEGNPIIQATGCIKLSINYAPTIVESDIEEYISLDDILSAITNYATIEYVDNNFVALSGAQTITGVKTFTSGIRTNTIARTSGGYTLTLPTEIGTIATREYCNNNYVMLGNVDQTINGIKTFSQGIKTARLFSASGYNIAVPNSGSGTLALQGWVSDNFYNKTQSDNKFATLTELNTDYYNKTETDNQIASAIESVKSNEFTIVDTTEYPTLSDFLESEGEEGFIYLYPIDTTDLSKGYYQYIWENNDWLAIGTTVIDLSNYATLDDLPQVITLATESGTGENLPFGIYDNFGKYILRYNNTLFYPRWMKSSGTPIASRGIYYDAITIGLIQNGKFSVSRNTIQATSTSWFLNESGQQTTYTDDEVDNLFTALKNNLVQIVDTSDYPTLADFLNEVGDIGTIYLYPIDTTDLSEGYYIYTYMYGDIVDDEWLFLGQTLLPNKENVSNKVTSISASSTDTQYPSAKCVYDNLKNVREVAEGKCQTVIISYDDSYTSVKNYLTTNNKKIYYNGEDVTNSFINGNYWVQVNWINGDFNDDTDQITPLDNVGEGYLLCKYGNQLNQLGVSEDYFIVFIGMQQMDQSSLHVGDIVLVEEADQPDRWFNPSGYGSFDILSLDDLYVYKTTTIAGIPLSSNISAQSLTDNLVYMNNTTDIDYVMED